MIQTIQLQHGAFFDPNETTYFPLYTDKIICCSEREANLYYVSGVKRMDISIAGAPLQTIGHKRMEEYEIKYDIVVVLTDTRPQELEIQKKALTYLRRHYNNKRILVRFRPRSMVQDKQNLSGFVDDFVISANTSLMHDLYSSKRVVTFSLDAVFEIIQSKKNFVVIVSRNTFYNEDLDGICYSIEDIDNALNNLFNCNDNKMKEHYITAFGETDEERICENFKKAISDFKKQQVKR